MSLPTDPTSAGATLDGGVLADLQRRLAAAGAVLFAIGMFTGLWGAAALTNVVKLTNPHLALAAHLNGLLGGLWLIALAWTLPYLRFTLVGLKRVGALIALSAYANWLVTVIASMLGVVGLEYTHDLANDVVAGLLQALVVLPGLVGSAGWAWGFLRASR